MTNEQKQLSVALVLLVLLALLVGVGPIFTIWSLNILFGLSIPLNFQTWCAVVWLTMLLHGIRITFRKDN